MKTRAVSMILLMIASALAGCTSGDPDGDGEMGIDADLLDQLIQDNLQDFINNTTVTVNQENHHYTNDTHITTNNMNASGAFSSSTLHTMAGTSAPYDDNLYALEDDNGLGILYREDRIPYWEGMSINSFNGAYICILIGSEIEALASSYFSSNHVSFTSVPSADSSESVSKFRDGSCDAIIEWTSNLDDIRQSVNPMPGNVAYSTYTIISYSGFYGYNQIELTISQEEGTSTALIGVSIQAKVIGNCLTNCTSDDDQINLNYQNYAWLNYVGAEDQYYWGIEYAVVTSTCDDNMSFMSNKIGYLMYPGLACEHTITAEFNPVINQYSSNYNNYELEKYEFYWTDWTYVLHWETTPVTLHE